MNLTITHIDTACILLEINGYRILTDPTLDNAGGLYYHGYGAASRKTESPAVPITSLQNIDLVLLSHHQHKDNLDTNGKAFLASTSARVLSTKKAAREMSQVTGLDNWETIAIETSKVKGLRITATPAHHHPWWIPEFISGTVIGFVIEFDGQQNGVIYISGDTVYFKGIEEVAKRYTVDIGIFHTGGVQFRYLTGLGKYTMDSKDLIRSVKALDPHTIIPIHYKGWTHFKEKENTLRSSIASHPFLRDKTIFLRPGKPTTLTRGK